MAALKSHAEALSELGLSGSVHDEDIRNAFRQRLKQAHPDISGGTDARLRRLILARDLLMSGQNKTSETLEPVQSSPHTQITGLPSAQLTITLHQALFGGTVTIDVPALEYAHISEPLVSLTQTKALRITLPPGLRTGENIRLACEGATGRKIWLNITIAPESDSHVWGDDIWMTARLENRLFQRGGETIVDTPHGPQEIRIDRGMPPGASLCLYGKGLPATANKPAGNLYIRLEACPDVVRPADHVLNDFRLRWAS